MTAKPRPHDPALVEGEGTSRGGDDARIGTILLSVAWWSAAGAVGLVPLLISYRGFDSFVLPKELILRAGAIVSLAALLISHSASAKNVARRLRKTRGALLLIGAAVVWTGITTMTSTNTQLSLDAFLYVLACAVLAGVTVIGAVDRRPTSALLVLIVPAVVNALLVISQAASIWDPIEWQGGGTIRAALLGNPGWVGAYLVTPALASVALVGVATTKAWRLIWVAGALLLFGGLMAAQSVTALLAYGVGVVTLAAVYSWRRAATVMLLVVFAASCAVVISEPVRQRAEMFASAIASRDLERFSSFRLMPIAAALAMFKDYPVVGVGPGCYALHYFDYKIRLQSAHPALRARDEHVFMFGEAHCDYAQVLAVAGMPGFAILAASLVYLGRRNRARGPSVPERRPRDFADVFARPLALSTATVMLAQFPLEMPAAVATMLYAASLCVAWRTSESVR